VACGKLAPFMVKLLPQFSTLHHVDELETYQIGYPRPPIFFLWKDWYGIGKAPNFFKQTAVSVKEATLFDSL
jgi:hypothetical protein